MVPLILTTALIQWFIPIKLDLDNQARAEKVFRANDWSLYHWPLLDKDSSGGGQLFAVEGALAWKKMAINYLGMYFLADLVWLDTNNRSSTFKGDLQLAATFKNLRMLSIDFARIAPPEYAPSDCIHLAFLRSLKELRTLDLTCYQKIDAI